MSTILTRNQYFSPSLWNLIIRTEIGGHTISDISLFRDEIWHNISVH